MLTTLALLVIGAIVGAAIMRTWMIIDEVRREPDGESYGPRR